MKSIKKQGEYKTKKANVIFATGHVVCWVIESVFILNRMLNTAQRVAHVLAVVYHQIKGISLMRKMI
jgi:uncharacterized membrane protein YciS (DUF1049 family)